MNKEIEIADLYEMLGICYTYTKAGHKKIQLDSEHVVEILERLIKHETSKGK